MPSKRSEIAQFGIWALVAGTPANVLNAPKAGMLVGWCMAFRLSSLETLHLAHNQRGREEARRGGTIIASRGRRTVGALG